MTDDHFERSEKSKNDEARAVEIFNQINLHSSSFKQVEIIAAALAQARADQREEDAKIADKLASEWWNDYKANKPTRGDLHYQGKSDGAEEVAAAIRKGA